MKKLLVITVLFFSTLQMQSQSTVFDALLETYVDSDGNVDYKGLRKNKAVLNVYLNELDKTNPYLNSDVDLNNSDKTDSEKEWSSDKAKAFWMNVYNAYTIKLILDSYPLTKITDIKRNGKSAWKIPFAKVGGKTYSLDHIEHKILRRWHDDPRVHVGLNAASKSGPKFINFTFTEENVDSKLDVLMNVFVNDKTKNKITLNKLEISKVFEWYKEDFTYKSTLIGYINRYSSNKVNDDAVVVYKEYDWTLNDKK